LNESLLPPELEIHELEESREYRHTAGQMAIANIRASVRRSSRDSIDRGVEKAYETTSDSGANFIFKKNTKKVNAIEYMQLKEESKYAQS
jgi:hypothetical protein